jgi:hypothetical protein
MSIEQPTAKGAEPETSREDADPAVIRARFQPPEMSVDRQPELGASLWGPEGDIEKANQAFKLTPDAADPFDGKSPELQNLGYPDIALNDEMPKSIPDSLKGFTSDLKRWFADKNNRGNPLPGAALDAWGDQLENAYKLEGSSQTSMIKYLRDIAGMVNKQLGKNPDGSDRFAILGFRDSEGTAHYYVSVARNSVEANQNRFDVEQGRSGRTVRSIGTQPKFGPDDYPVEQV